MEKHVLQWHITHKCNLRCSHCYQEEYSEDLTLSQIQEIFNQYLCFLVAKGYKGHINLTGGEPFLYPHLFEVLDLFEDNKVTFGILTNGTLLEEKIVEKLSQYRGLSFVQISIDGAKTTHEQIRGRGTFRKSLEATKLLRKYDITSMVSFTAHKANYKELKKVIKVVKKYRVDRFWTDRLIPIGNTEEILSTEEFLSYVSVLTHEARKAEKSRLTHTTIHINRALQFCGGSNQIYHCSAGIQLLTILANGDIVPCRRLPIVFGNVLEKNILELYEASEIIKVLQHMPKECLKCYKAPYCKGGLRCLTYAVTKDLNKKDINCLLISEESL